MPGPARCFKTLHPCAALEDTTMWSRVPIPRNRLKKTRREPCKPFQSEPAIVQVAMTLGGISVRQEFLRALPRTIGFALAPVQDSAYTRAVDTRAVNVRMTFLSRAGLPRPFVFVCSGAHRVTPDGIMKQDRRRQPLGQQKRTVKEMNATWLTHPWRNSKPS